MLLGTHGAAHTYSPILIADISLEAHTHVHLPVKRNMAGFVYVMEGEGFFGGDLPKDTQEGADIIAGKRKPEARSLGQVGRHEMVLNINKVSAKDGSDAHDQDDFVVTTIQSGVRFLLCLGEPLGECARSCVGCARVALTVTYLMKLRAAD